MKNLFERASSYWVRYDAYELREGQNGTLYVTPAKDAQPQVYNPLADPEKLVLDALNVGMLAMGRKAPEAIQKGVMDFVNTYGLLGFMTALPTTSSFMNYEAVYLPKNSYIREESMQTMVTWNCSILLKNWIWQNPVLNPFGISMRKE